MKRIIAGLEFLINTFQFMLKKCEKTLNGKMGYHMYVISCNILANEVNLFRVIKKTKNKAS